MKLNYKAFWAVGILLIVVVIGFVGYRAYTTNSDKNETSSVMQKDSTAEKKPEISNAVINTGDSEFGEMLFDDKGQAIYIWELEESAEAECYGDCAEAWPPVLTDGAPSATGNVNSDLLGTTQRSDGSTQVTYSDHPLYYYAPEKPGEVGCHNVSTHGGLWWVIQPNGIRAD